MLQKSSNTWILNRSIVLFACVLLLPFLFSQTAFGQQRKRLAIISAYHESAPWVQNLFISLTLDLADRSDIVIDPVYMNATLITDSTYYNRTVDGIFQHFKNKKPDYLIMFGGMCITLRDRIREEWGDIPFILVSKTDLYGPPVYYFTGDSALYPSELLRPIEEIRGKYNFTFIQSPDLEELTTDMMLTMQPSIRKIVMLADASYHNRYLAAETGKYIAKNRPDIEYEWLISKDENVSTMQSYLTDYNPEIGILLCSWFYGRRGTLGNLEVLTGGVNLIPSVEQPVITLRESYLAEGAVGGYFPEIKQIKQSLLSATNKMLDGVPMNDIPFVFEHDLHKLPIVNYALLNENHLSEALCPENTRFINKPLSFWSKYKIYCILGFIILFLASSFFTLRILLQRRQLKLFRRYNTLLSNMPIGYTQGKILFNANGKIADLEYHSSNQAFLNLLEENSIPGEPDKIFPKPYIAAHVEKLLKEGLPCLFSYHFKKTDHYYNFLLCLVQEDTDRLPHINLKEKKKVKNVDLFAVDVTDRSRAEKVLRNLTDKLGLTLQLTHIFPWEWNLDTHEISCDIYSLRNTSTQNRHRPSSVVAMKESTFFRRIHREDTEKVREIYQDLIQNKSSYVSTEFRVLNALGNKTEWFEINAIITERDETGNPSMISGSLLVITERKEQEQELIDARSQAQESDRMKSAFLANMSHEIRTPLNAIVGFSGLLSKTNDPEKKRKFVDLIESNNSLLLQLISDVLDLAKVESNTLEFYYHTVNLNELMSKIEQSIRFKVKEGVELRCFTGAESCVIETEPNRLAQLINNLLTNSCKFTTQGSIEFGYEIQGKNLYFYVKDTGIGISFENQQKLFQRFSKLNNFAQGTGLGLSICKGIVEKMGGCIGVVSSGEGKGSKFWFTIPFKPTAESEPAEAPKAVEQTVTESRSNTILIAEDNESNYMLFQSILESDYKLIHAWDGVEAVALFKEHRPQAILMDIGMPNMDGYEATQEIRKISATVPIIAVTAFAFASDKSRILASGFNSYISKPINAANLLQELESALGKKNA